MIRKALAWVAVGGLVTFIVGVPIGIAGIVVGKPKLLAVAGVGALTFWGAFAAILLILLGDIAREEEDTERRRQYEPPEVSALGYARLEGWSEDELAEMSDDEFKRIVDQLQDGSWTTWRSTG